MTDTAYSIDHRREKSQLLAAKVSFWGSIALFLISAAAGIAVDSITLILDASASLVILVVAVLMNTSIKKVHLPPDEFFNFGYEKYEPFTVVMQGGLIIATCVISVKFAIQDIVHAEEIKNYYIPIYAAFVCGIIGVFISLFLKGTARASNSSMLHTASMHWLIDTGMSFGMCGGFYIGLVLEERGYHTTTHYVDPVMAIILAVIFIIPPIKTISRNVMELLDAVPSRDVRAKIRKVVEEYKPRSFGIHRLRSRKAGEKIFIDICFVVEGELTVSEVEELAADFEKDIKTNLPRSDVVVYFKPAASK